MTDANVVQPCGKCGEAPRGEDPSLSNGICVFCGYWSCLPGPEREKMRAERHEKALQTETPAPRPDVGLRDVPKTKCECTWCLDPEAKPMNVTILCPQCGERHIDQLDPVTGIDWSKKNHHRHRCGNCEFEWAPSLIPTVGV